MAKRPVKKPVKKSPKPTPKPKAKPAAKKVAAKPVAKPAGKKPAGKPAARPTARAGAPSRSTPPTRRATILQPPPPPPLPTIRPPAADAVAQLERGMRDLQKHDYAAAAATFKKLVADFPTEGFLADRARVYLELAEREVRKRAGHQATVEERLTAATAALNNDRDEDAARLAESVIKEDGSQDLAVYLLAVIATRAGRNDDAITRLREAIDLNPECRVQARHDEEFDPLMEHPEYQQLMEAPPTPVNPAGAKRPAKRGR